MRLERSSRRGLLGEIKSKRRGLREETNKKDRVGLSRIAVIRMRRRETHFYLREKERGITSLFASSSYIYVRNNKHVCITAMVISYKGTKSKLFVAITSPSSSVEEYTFGKDRC